MNCLFGEDEKITDEIMPGLAGCRRFRWPGLLCWLMETKYSKNDGARLQTRRLHLCFCYTCPLWKLVCRWKIHIDPLRKYINKKAHFPASHVKIRVYRKATAYLQSTSSNRKKKNKVVFRVHSLSKMECIIEHPKKKETQNVGSRHIIQRVFRVEGYPPGN